MEHSDEIVQHPFSELNAEDTTDNANSPLSWTNLEPAQGQFYNQETVVASQKSAGFEEEMEVENPTQALQKMLKENPRIITFKQELFGDNDSSQSRSDSQSSLSESCPHPVSLVKVSSPTKPVDVSNISRSSRVSTMLKNAQKKPSLAVASESLETSQEVCLVCGAPCHNIKPPRIAFCHTCKKAYFQQQALKTEMGRLKRKPGVRKCVKGGQCVINYLRPHKWCSVCHTKKFNEILSTLRYTIIGSDIIDPFELYRQTMPDQVKNLRARSSISEEIVNSSVPLVRLSKEDLADYGIEIENHIKEEPLEPEPFKDQTPKRSKRKHKLSTKLTVSTKSLVQKKSEVLPKRTENDKNPSRLINPKAKKILTDKIAPSSDSEYKIKKSINMKKQVAEHSYVPKILKTSKVLMDRIISSDSDSECENDSSVNKTTPYSLPAVNIGRHHVASSADQFKLNRQNYSEILQSIKVYVFNCGHACGMCNSKASIAWLKDSGFYTSQPLSQDPPPSSSTQAKSAKPNGDKCGNNGPTNISAGSGTKQTKSLALSQCQVAKQIENQKTKFNDLNSEPSTPIVNEEPTSNHLANTEENNFVVQMADGAEVAMLPNTSENATGSLVEILTMDQLEKQGFIISPVSSANL